VLTGAGFGDDPGLAHAPGQQGLADAVIHLVGTGVVQVFPLQINLGATEDFGPALGVENRAGTAHVVLQFVGEFCLEGRVLLGRGIGLVQLGQGRHQGFGHKTAAVGAEMALGVWQIVGTGHHTLLRKKGKAKATVRGFARNGPFPFQG